MHYRKNEAGTERERQRLESRTISDCYPEVSSIVVKMRYIKEGTTAMLRTLNFYPESHSYFRMSCLGEGCENGGLDLTRIISRMVRGHEKSAKGELRCRNTDPDAVHADINYTVSMKYL